MKDSTSAKLLYYFFKSLGLVPATRDAKNLLRTSTPSLLYSAIFAVHVLAANCYAVKLTLRDNPAVPFDRTIDAAHTIIGSTASFVVIGMFCIHREKFVGIANRLRVLYELTAFRRKGMLTRVVGQTCLVVFFTWLPIFLTIPVGSWQAVLYFTATYFCDAIVCGAMLQYSLLLGLLKHLFVMVNGYFSKLTSEQRILDQLAVARFARLRELHMELSEVCEDLGNFYSRPVLLCVCHIFTSLILDAYYVVKSMFFNKTGISTAFTLNCFAQLVHGLSVLLILTRSASVVVEEIKRTGKIINKWTDDRSMPKVSQFSSYLLHQNITFSAAGLFAIDGTLLTSVVGSITTYIVILLQFQDRKSTEASN